MYYAASFLRCGSVGELPLLLCRPGVELRVPVRDLSEYQMGCGRSGELNVN